MTVSSPPGQGATFRVYLPRVSDDAVLEASAQKPTRSTGVESILVIEDEPAVRRLIRLVLERGGYTVIETGRGEDALARSNAHPGEIALIITDVMIPGMSAAELVTQLRQQRPGIKALFISGYPDDDVVRRGLLVSAVAWMQKPFGPAALNQKVREVLDSAGNGG
ncbi:MAG: response regulator [Acidobacteriota bacterium]